MDLKCRRSIWEKEILLVLNYDDASSYKFEWSDLKTLSNPDPTIGIDQGLLDKLKAKITEHENYIKQQCTENSNDLAAVLEKYPIKFDQATIDKFKASNTSRKRKRSSSPPEKRKVKMFKTEENEEEKDKQNENSSSDSNSESGSSSSDSSDSSSSSENPTKIKFAEKFEPVQNPIKGNEAWHINIVNHIQEEDMYGSSDSDENYDDFKPMTLEQRRWKM